MSVLCMTTPGTKLHLKEGRAEVRREGIIQESIPVHQLERVMVFGSKVQLTGEVMQQLLYQGTPILFFSGKGRYLGILQRGSGNIEELLSQFMCWQKPGFRLEKSRQWVRVKIGNQRAVLAAYQHNHPAAGLASAMAELERYRGKAEQAASIPELLGVEGIAARCYFGVLGQCLRQPGLEFYHRSRRPPKDPVNAMLSFGYALLQGEVTHWLLQAGLHTGMGILHEPSRRRDALVLDIMELFRQPVVDQLVLSVINRNQFSLKDFVRNEEEGIRFTSEALGRYLQLFEEKLNRLILPISNRTYRDRIGQEIKALKDEMMAV